MKLSTTPIILASIALSSPVLSAPIDATNSPDLGSARSPAIARVRMMGSPAIREGSGSRRSLPRFRKRDAPIPTNGLPLLPTPSTPSAAHGLSGLGFDLPAPVNSAISDLTGDIDSILNEAGQVPTVISGLTSETTPDLKSIMSTAGTGASPLPLSTVTGAVDGLLASVTPTLKSVTDIPQSVTSSLSTVEGAVQPIENVVDEDLTPKLSSSAPAPASNILNGLLESHSKRYERSPLASLPTAVVGSILSSATGIPSRATDATAAVSIPAIVISSATDKLASPTTLPLASTVTAAPSSATLVVKSAAAVSTEALEPAIKHHFNPFLDNAPFSVVPAELMRPGFVYANGVTQGSGFEAQTVSESSLQPSHSLSSATSSATTSASH